MPALALHRGFALGSRPTYRFCRNVLSSVHACCLTHSAKQDGLRYLAFLFRGSRSPFARSRGIGSVICLGGFTSGLAVYLWRSRRGYRSTGYGRTRLAAQPLHPFAQAHWSCYAFRGEYVGAARPQTCAKESSTLWTLLTLRRGCGWYVYATPSPGHTERPARL